MAYETIERRLVDGTPAFFATDHEGDTWTATSLEALLAGQAERTSTPPTDAPLLAPTAPTKVVCIGLNYRSHAEEMGKALPDEPLMFLKPPSSVIGPEEAIELPQQSGLVHHEAELAVVIGRRAKRVSASDAADYILGFTLLNDVTARDLQRNDVQYTRAKGFDTFAPCGPRIVFGLVPERLELQLRVNGELRQRGTCDDLIFSVSELIAHISSVMTLEVGDIISTGTPSGVGELHDGDVVTIENREIGVLRNPVRKA